MYPVTKSLAAMALLAVLAVLAACSGPSLKEQPSSEFSAEQLYPVRGSGFAEAYARRDANLPAFSSVNIESLDLTGLEVTQTAVSGTVARDWQMTPEREANLRQSWVEAMLRAFVDYQQVGADGSVLRITARLTRVTPGRSTSTATTSGGARVAGSGDTVDISAEFRLYDQGSGVLLAVIRDRRTIASLQWSRAAGVDMVNLFRAWAGLLHTRVSGR